MLDFQQKRKVRSIMYNRITIYILAVVALLLIHSTWSVYQKKKESEELKKVSIERVEELRKRDEELSYQIERLDTTPGIEEEIRTKFNVAKDNENIVVVVTEDETQEKSTTTKLGFWAKFIKFFTKN